LSTSIHYCCQRALLLGALYDTLDRLHWSLTESSSQSGVFRARNPGRESEITIHLDPVVTPPCFQVSVDPEDITTPGAEQFLRVLTETLNEVRPGVIVKKEVETCEKD